MSEYLKNREYKKEVLKKLITDLHQGRDFDQVKEEFNEFVEGVDAVELADIEQQLIGEGMKPEEITRLCDVHAALVRDAVNKNEMKLVPGHPLYSLHHENGAARKELDVLGDYLDKLSQRENPAGEELLGDFREMLTSFRENIDKHYGKKENLLFPFLEKHNITGPPSVMWSVDDEIREMLKETDTLIDELQEGKKEYQELKEKFSLVQAKISEMFSKEEDILTPMLSEELTDEEWAVIKKGERDFGVVFSPPEADIWQPAAGGPGEKGAPETGKTAVGEAASPGGAGEGIKLDTGSLTPAEINTILKNLPVDITFVGQDNAVRYFSQTRERVFTRTEAIIGRKVQNCHPPESVHIVEKIISDFKAGREDRAEFWLELGGHFIFIQYLALKDESGKYLGTMEVSQDLTRARSLQGERRLLKYGEE